MEKTQLESYRKQIEDIVARLRLDATAAVEGIRDPSIAEEPSNAPMHLADRGSEEFFRDLNATLLENEQYCLDEAWAALQRIQSGAFGRCERCDKDIPDERLEAIPYARYCLACAAVIPPTVVNFNDGRPQRPTDTLAGQQAIHDDRSQNEQSMGAAPETLAEHVVGFPPAPA